MIVDHTLAAPVKSTPVSQVSWPASPGGGMVWKIQRSWPVRTSKAGTSRGGESGRSVSAIEEPTMATSPTMVGGEVTRRSPR